MSFATLKKASKSGQTFAKLTQEIEKLKQPQQGSANDERFWKPEIDKSGNGYAVIRFLDSPNGEDRPFAQVWSHAFKGQGGWYIENSLTTLGKKDPVSDFNTTLWNAGGEGSPQRAQARQQKRKLSYYSNIYVVSDPVHPENEGQVFLYKYGKKIFDKITEAMQPAFKDETPLDAYNLWNAADFKIKIRKVDGYWNYDKSDFAAPGVLGGFDDAQLEEIWNKCYSLAEFEDPKNFKSYEDLEKRLNNVLALNKAPAPAVVDESEEEVTPQKWGKEVSEFREKAVAASPVEDEENTLSYFASLAQED